MASIEIKTSIDKRPFRSTNHCPKCGTFELDPSYYAKCHIPLPPPPPLFNRKFFIGDTLKVTCLKCGWFCFEETFDKAPAFDPRAKVEVLPAEKNSFWLPIVERLCFAGWCLVYFFLFAGFLLFAIIVLSILQWTFLP